MSTSVGGPPVNHNHNHSESMNSRGPANGNNAVHSDHARAPSMTVTPTGASFNANGASQGKVTNIQFGSANVVESPALGTPQMAHQSSNSLGVNSLNPRGNSPQGSPSPIPQPSQVSGGRPPSAFQASSSFHFGQINPGDGDQPGPVRATPSMPYGSPQPDAHMRRGSSQSMQGDGVSQGPPTGPGRGGFHGQGGRGRNGYAYQGQGAYGSHQNFRPQNGRGMNSSGYSNQGRHQAPPYQSSPNLGTRSPMMNAANPGTPQMAQMHMMPNVPSQQAQYYMGPQGFNVPTQADPSLQYLYQMNAPYPQIPSQYSYVPPQSPRPHYQQPGYGAHMQQTYSSQGPPSMSRQSSQMSSTADRPSSGIGQAPHTPSINPAHVSARTPSMSAQKSEFTVPTKKSAALVIKNAQGEVLDFKKSGASASATPAGSTPAVPTPPSRTPSAADHVRPESSVKTDEDKKKAMQEAVAKRVAEEKESQARQEREAAEQEAQMEKEAADAARREAEAKAAEAEALEKEAKEAEAKKAAEAEKSATVPVAADDAATADEIDFDAIEAELAAQEAEEARREEEYQKKKAAAREAQRKKEQEEAAAYEANMKEAERKAEEEEIAREKKRADGVVIEDSESRKLFAALKAGQGATPASTADGSPTQTPAESGTVTPISESSVPAGKTLPTRRAKAADLTLDTKRSVEPPEPSATLKSLIAARSIEDPASVSYPEGIASPDAALNATASSDRGFKYNKEFLLQFQSVFTEKPSIDWDNKIRESLGDGEGSARPNTARTPSGMGGKSASNRPAANAGLQMMGAFAGRGALPPGTTSEQRFAAANAQMRGGPMSNPFASGRPGNMGPPMGGRTPSNNPFGGIPGSPRPGGPSRGGQRNESKRSKQNSKQEVEANKSMPLTAGMNVGSLEVSSTGWKARSLGQPQSGPTPGGDGYLEPDVVQRKVKAALNKMTPEKFDKIADQILEIAAQARHESDGRTLRQVIQLTFEKATDEAHWAPMYAMFCRKMLQSMSPEIKDENIKDKNGEVVTGGNLFRKYLLNRCQEEFERGWKIDLPGRKEGETEEAAMLSEEYYKAAAAKRRGLGLVKFIGELFKLGMLTERIMHECVKKLVDYEGTPEEAEVESLTSLLRTIGKQLDSSESKAQGRMDVYFERIRQTIDIPDLPSRLRFMLMDVVDLRRNGWVSSQDDKGPKTITEIRETAEREARQAELNRLANQGGRGGGRMPMGRGDARSFSGYNQMPPPDTSNRVGADDLRKLGGRASRNASSTGPGSLGPPSLLGGRTNSGRRGLGPGGLLSRGGEDSNASSRTGTPPAQKDKEKKDESSTNAFSALAALDSHDGHDDPSSPPTQKVQPKIEREQSRSPAKAE